MRLWCELYHETHGKDVAFESLNQYDVASLLGIPTSEFYRLLDQVWYDWRRIPPTEDALSSKVAPLKNLGQVDIVTGRSRITEEAAEKWLRYRRIPYDDFVRTVGLMAKLKLDYDVYIDDAPDLMKAISSSMNRHGVLYERPWNGSLAALPRVHRVRSWSEIPPLISKLEMRRTPPGSWQ